MRTLVRRRRQPSAMVFSRQALACMSKGAGLEEHGTVLEVTGSTVLPSWRQRQTSQAPRRQAVACGAAAGDCKQHRSKHLCMQPCTPGNSRSHSCSTSWHGNNSCPS